MKTFRDKSILRVLGLALVLGVLFVGGWAGDSFARMNVQNGHEGDPTDGNDVGSGGSGSISDGDSEQPNLSWDGNKPLDLGIGVILPDLGYIEIYFEDGLPVWRFVFDPNRGEK